VQEEKEAHAINGVDEQIQRNSTTIGPVRLKRLSNTETGSATACIERDPLLQTLAIFLMVGILGG